MSWYGHHPVMPKAEAQAQRANAGMPPCKRCVYETRLTGMVHSCTRCCGTRTKLRDGFQVSWVAIEQFELFYKAGGRKVW